MSSISSTDVETTLTKLTEKATQLEADLQELRVAKLHQDNKTHHSDNKSDISKDTNIAANIEERLQRLHALLLEDRDEAEEIRAQRDDTRAENERLRQTITKHEYRIKHLLRTIEELEQKMELQQKLEILSLEKELIN